MFKAHLVVLVAVLVCLCLMPSPRAGTAADEPRPPAGEADFTGKVLVVSMDAPEKFGAVLEQVQVRKLGGRAFLVGKAVDDGREGGSFYKGRTLWIAVERVTHMVEFANLDELKKAYEQGNGR
jgi:hypothetical protein